MVLKWKIHLIFIFAAIVIFCHSPSSASAQKRGILSPQNKDQVFFAKAMDVCPNAKTTYNFGVSRFGPEPDKKLFHFFYYFSGYDETGDLKERVASGTMTADFVLRSYRGVIYQGKKEVQSMTLGIAGGKAHLTNTKTNQIQISSYNKDLVFAPFLGLYFLNKIRKNELSESMFISNFVVFGGNHLFYPEEKFKVSKEGQYMIFKLVMNKINLSFKLKADGPLGGTTTYSDDQVSYCAEQTTYEEMRKSKFKFNEDRFKEALGKDFQENVKK